MCNCQTSLTYPHKQRHRNIQEDCLRAKNKHGYSFTISRHSLKKEKYVFWLAIHVDVFFFFWKMCWVRRNVVILCLSITLEIHRLSTTTFCIVSGWVVTKDITAFAWEDAPGKAHGLSPEGGPSVGHCVPVGEHSSPQASSTHPAELWKSSWILRLVLTLPPPAP